MKNVIITIFFLCFLPSLFGQNTKNQKLEYASELLTTRINDLGKMGYLIKEVKISRDFGWLELTNFTLMQGRFDTIFIESYVIYKDGSYGIGPGAGITVAKTVTTKSEKTTSNVNLENTEIFSKLSNLNDVYRFKSYFIPTPQEKRMSFNTNYRFNIMLTEEERGTTVVTVTPGAKPKDYSKAVTLLIYVNNK